MIGVAPLQLRGPITCAIGTCPHWDGTVTLSVGHPETRNLGALSVQISRAWGPFFGTEGPSIRGIELAEQAALLFEPLPNHALQSLIDEAQSIGLLRLAKLASQEGRSLSDTEIESCTGVKPGLETHDAEANRSWFLGAVAQVFADPIVQPDAEVVRLYGFETYSNDAVFRALPSHLAQRLGELMMLWRWRADGLDRQASTGKHVIDSAKNGRDALAAMRHPVQARILEAMARRMAKRPNVSEAAKGAAKEHGGSWEAHRQLWYRRKRQKKL